MCFGMEQTQQNDSLQNVNMNTANTAHQSTDANPQVARSAWENLDFVRNLQTQGFQGYGGQQVAGLDPMQANSIAAGGAIANNGTGTAARGLIDQYSRGPAQNVNAKTISSAMSPYMNQYVMQALAPQMRQMDMQDASQNRAVDAQATSAGAFGDARQGIESANNTFNQGVARTGMIGQAYNNAFNTAIGAGAQDVSNNLAAQNANAGYAETALNRALGGANAMQGLQNQQMGVQGAANALGQQRTAQDQAGLTAQYNQWLMAQQYPFQTAQLANSTLGASAGATPGNTTTSTAGSQIGTTVGNTSQSQPNNSGWGIAGSLLSAFI